MTQEDLKNYSKKIQKKFIDLKKKAEGLDEKQKKNALIIGSFIILLVLSLMSEFLRALIPIALVSYTLSQVGGFKSELKKLKGEEKLPPEDSQRDSE